MTWFALYSGVYAGWASAEGDMSGESAPPAREMEYTLLNANLALKHGVCMLHPGHAALARAKSHSAGRSVWRVQPLVCTFDSIDDDRVGLGSSSCPTKLSQRQGDGSRCVPTAGCCDDSQTSPLPSFSKSRRGYIVSKKETGSLQPSTAHSCWSYVQPRRIKIGSVQRKWLHSRDG